MFPALLITSEDISCDTGANDREVSSRLEPVCWELEDHETGSRGWHGTSPAVFLQIPRFRCRVDIQVVFVIIKTRSKTKCASEREW